MRRYCCPRTYFYPRPPRGGRRAALTFLASLRKDFYPRPPRGGRLQHPHTKDRPHLISIHALREEGDWSGRAYSKDTKISIHALREEGDYRAVPCL